MSAFRDVATQHKSGPIGDYGLRAGMRPQDTRLAGEATNDSFYEDLPLSAFNNRQRPRRDATTFDDTGLDRGALIVSFYGNAGKSLDRNRR